MITLAAAVLTATLAFAQTSPTTSSDAAMGTTESGAGPTTPDSMIIQTTDTTATPANTAASTQNVSDRDFGSTMMWLIPLLIILAIAFPFIRRRMSGNDNMPASPRV